MKIYTLSLACCIGFISAKSQEFTIPDNEAIHQQLRQMESLLKQKDMKGLAAIYLPDGYLLSPYGNPITGREAIDAYWERISDPLDWKLEALVTSEDPVAIFAHEHYLSMKNKPPGWTELGLELTDVVYQLGISTLKSKWEGKETTSVVDFILLWKKQPGGGWLILVDSYVSNK